MACKKSELASAINSFGAARASQDASLLQFAVNLVSQLMDTLEFAPEEEATEEINGAEVYDAKETSYRSDEGVERN